MLYQYPVPPEKVKAVSQWFGEHPENYPSTKGHMGIDWGLAEGTPVLAAAPGTVTVAGVDPETQRNARTGYGLHVCLVHEDDSMTIYGHLSALKVQAGETVAVGQPVGLSGNTGRSDGPHLHFELRPKSAVKIAVDPKPFLVASLATSALCKGEVVSNVLNFRSRTSTDDGYLATLTQGTTFEVVGLPPDAWIKARITSGPQAGKVGFLRVSETVGNATQGTRVAEYVRLYGGGEDLAVEAETPDVDERLDKLWAAHPELHR